MFVFLDKVVVVPMQSEAQFCKPSICEHVIKNEIHINPNSSRKPEKHRITKLEPSQIEEELIDQLSFLSSRSWTGSNLAVGPALSPLISLWYLAVVPAHFCLARQPALVRNRCWLIPAKQKLSKVSVVCIRNIGRGGDC